MVIRRKRRWILFVATLAAVVAAVVGFSRKGAPPLRLRRGEPVLGPVKAALAGISRERFEADVRALSGPRHHSSSGEALSAAAAFIALDLSRSGLRVSELSVEHEGFKAPVIVGERAGSAGEAVVLIVAHYDSVEGSPGADDNASGVAGLLAIARVLRDVPTRATIRCVAVPFEEQGLVGSRAYAAALSEEERRRVLGVFVLEMIGFVDPTPSSQRYPDGLGLLFPGRDFRDTGDFIAAFGESARPLPLEALEAARSYVPELRVETLSLPGFVAQMPDMRRSDHAPFWEVGVPAAFIGDTANFRTPHYHRPTDTPETLDFGFATKAAQWVAAAALLLADPA